jgi:hypothetical protein
MTGNCTLFRTFPFMPGVNSNFLGAAARLTNHVPSGADK